MPDILEQAMPEKQTLFEVIPDKIWITRNEFGVKTGTVICIPSGYRWLSVNGSQEDFENLDAFEIDKSKAVALEEKDLLGYPIPAVDVYDVHQQKDMICYTRRPGSDTVYVAGYWVVKFPTTGWAERFSPRLSTLQKREHLGPFKTVADKDLVLLRKKREDR